MSPLFNSKPRRDDYDDDDDDDGRHDYFSDTEIPDPEPKHEKRPALKPEDPDFWEQEESEWEHLIPSRHTTWRLWVAGLIVVIVLLTAFWMRFFNPYREAATQYGYVESIETRGKFFKTMEGVLLPYKELMDTTRIYSRDFTFTVANKKLAAKLHDAMTANRPVMVTYKEYNATLPWRGESRVVVTNVSFADPNKILPPEFAPRLQ